MRRRSERARARSVSVGVAQCPDKVVVFVSDIGTSNTVLTSLTDGTDESLDVCVSLALDTRVTPRSHHDAPPCPLPPRPPVSPPPTQPRPPAPAPAPRRVLVVREPRRVQPVLFPHPLAPRRGRRLGRRVTAPGRKRVMVRARPSPARSGHYVAVRANTGAFLEEGLVVVGGDAGAVGVGAVAEKRKQQRPTSRTPPAAPASTVVRPVLVVVLVVVIIPITVVVVRRVVLATAPSPPSSFRRQVSRDGRRRRRRRRL